MKFALAACGTRGDVVEYTPAGLELARRVPQQQVALRSEGV